MSIIQFRNIGVLLRDNSQRFPLEMIEEAFSKVGAKVHVLNWEEPEISMDVIMAMGGDGTVLRALDMQYDCPVIGINYGTVGFLTSGDRSELESILTRLLEGRYVLSERVMLSCRRGEKVYHAVNEVVLRTSFRMAHIEVFLDETKIRTIRGDGVIVGTPTGSTGYLLSTGGPIVMPGADCFVMDGINEYNYTSRSIVVHTGVKIRLQMGDLQTHQKSHMFIDGTEICEIGPGENVYLEKSPRKARLLFFEENHFFHNLSSRLSWQ